MEKNDQINYENMLYEYVKKEDGMYYYSYVFNDLLEDENE